MYDKDNENLGIDAQIIQDALYGILTGEWNTEDTALDDLAEVRTFEAAGVMTYNKGLAIRLRDGTSFQITIV